MNLNYQSIHTKGQWKLKCSLLRRLRWWGDNDGDRWWGWYVCVAAIRGDDQCHQYQSLIYTDPRVWDLGDHFIKNLNISLDSLIDTFVDIKLWQVPRLKVCFQGTKWFSNQAWKEPSQKFHNHRRRPLLRPMVSIIIFAEVS